MELIGRYEDGSRNPALDAGRPAADHYIIGAHSPLAELERAKRIAARHAIHPFRAQTIPSSILEDGLCLRIEWENGVASPEPQPELPDPVVEPTRPRLL